MWEAGSSPTSTAASPGRRPAAASRSISPASSARTWAATALPSSTLAAIHAPAAVRPDTVHPRAFHLGGARANRGGPGSRSRRAWVALAEALVEADRAALVAHAPLVERHRHRAGQERVEHHQGGALGVAPALHRAQQGGADPAAPRGRLDA